MSTTTKITNPMFNISYGLYLLSIKGEKDSGCIINTVNQVSEKPNCVTISVNKANYTCEILNKTGVCNISILTEETPFHLIKRFGFTSGRDTDKFFGWDYTYRTSNGVLALNKYSNSAISLKVIDKKDLGSHILFITEVESSEILSQVASVTYGYYLKNIKPIVNTNKKGFICKICGYIYEGETLPPDFICPICKHGAIDFEPIR